MMLYRARFGFGILIYFVMVLGIAMGANAGYEAQTVADTEIEYTGESVIVGGNETELNTTIEPDEPATDPVDRTIQNGVIDFSETLLHACFTMAFTVADYVATGTYYISPVVPQFVVGGVLNVLSAVPVIGGVYVLLTRVQEIA